MIFCVLVFRYSVKEQKQVFLIISHIYLKSLQKTGIKYKEINFLYISFIIPFVFYLLLI